MDAQRTGRVQPEHDYRTLPVTTPLDQTIATVDADPLPDPHAGRNVDQDDALRDC
ncbi:MAG TPA: hypothetical protein VNS81_09025 [Nocardioides sp.]|nr:hypothetical protein [Nocardioides sp.]